MNPQISTALTSGLRQLSETPASFPAPSIEYGLLSPLLIVFGVAVFGVLVEAFAPRPRRYLIQSVLAMAEFNPGQRYEDFDSNLDEVAAYGIGALVAGKVAAKAGLLAAGLVLLKKFGIFILLGLGAFARKLKGLFSRPNPTAGAS